MDLFQFLGFRLIKNCGQTNYLKGYLKDAYRFRYSIND